MKYVDDMLTVCYLCDICDMLMICDSMTYLFVLKEIRSYLNDSGKITWLCLCLSGSAVFSAVIDWSYEYMNIFDWSLHFNYLTSSKREVVHSYTIV